MPGDPCCCLSCRVPCYILGYRRAVFFRAEDDAGASLKPSVILASHRGELLSQIGHVLILRPDY